MNAISFEELPKAVVRLYEKLTDIEKLILSKDFTSQKEADQLLTIKEASEFLHLSIATLYGSCNKIL